MNIYDIAKRAGVSIATVSRVLNHSPNVSQKTRERVEAVMKESNYTPNVFARGLGLNSMKMIGVLCTDVSDIFYAQAVSIIENNLRREGYHAILCCTGSEMKSKKKSIELLLSKRVDAIILVGSAFQEQFDHSHIEAAAKKVPVIIINGLIELPNTYCILCDEYKAVFQTVSSMLSGGCRKILYLYDTQTYSGMKKLMGYQDACGAFGIPYEQQIIQKVPKNLESVTQIVLESRDEEGRFPFDGVMASEDLLAIGALKALKGKKIPVVGINNSVLAECSTPALSSIDNMLLSLCTTSVQILSQIFEDYTVPQKISYNAKLIERESFHPREVNSPVLTAD